MTVVRRTGSNRRSPGRTPGGHGGGGTTTGCSAEGEDDGPEDDLDQISSVDLTSENLPPVDTPDACDKAALR